MNPLRDKLHALIDELVDALESGGASEWVDQNTSPLGRERHLRLAAKGIIPSSKVQRHVWIRRRDIDAYLSKHSRDTADEATKQSRDVQRVIANLGKKNSAA